VELPAQSGIRLVAESPAYHRGGRVRAERPEPEPGHACAGPQFVQQRRLVRPGADGQEQRDRQPVQAGGQMREPAQRRSVGPVQVVHREHQRLPGREVRGQPVQAVRGGVGDVVLDRAGLGPVEHPGGQPGRPVQQAVLAARGVKQHRVEQLADDAVGEALFQCEPAGGQHAQAVAPAAGRPEQRGLADPGRPLHQDQAAVTGRGGRRGGGQRGEFLLALENDRVTYAHDWSVFLPVPRRKAQGVTGIRPDPRPATVES
jgi:hypothetical protein